MIGLMVVIGALVCAPALAQPVESTRPPTLIMPFSKGKPGGELPAGWFAFQAVLDRSPTVYRIVADGGTSVLHAQSRASSSSLLHPTYIDVNATPIVQWRWRISKVLAGTDNSAAGKEDAPARVLLGFDGDKSKLRFRDRSMAAIAKRSTGREPPYAQLIYIWSADAPVGTVIRDPQSQRAAMIVAASGADRAGKWMSVSRDVRADFRQAFGEEPGALTTIGVRTDTDDTAGSVDAWYGDIRLVGARAAASRQVR